MEKDFGVNIAPYLFEPENGTTIEGIRTEAINALYKFEPRISDIQAEIEMHGGAIVVNVTYHVRQNGIVGSVAVKYPKFAGP
jgi:phage baseplate assembly protein W